MAAPTDAIDSRPARSRRSGVLLHPTALPGRFGCGDLGPAAMAFVDWAAAAGQSIWQVLPLGPVGPHLSPYSSPSAFAGNALLISPERLVEDGLLPAARLAELPIRPEGRVSGDVVELKEGLVRESYLHFVRFAPAPLRAELERFRDEQRAWLDDWAHYSVLRDVYGPLGRWPEPLRARERSALAAALDELGAEVELHVYAQFLFALQWRRLHESTRRRGVVLFGDLPIYVSGGSADVWARPELFQLDAGFEPAAVAGVPPDAFSDTGQLWGNPLYDWEAMARDGYAWWVARLRHALTLTDAVRIDHFRAFAGFWTIPAGSSTAETGSWRPGPGAALFAALRAALGELPVVAEDLGVITPDVEELLHETGLPGMRVLQFGVAHGDSPHAPHRFAPHCVCYTGTHDNDTGVGWHAALEPETRRRVERYLGATNDDVAWGLIRAAHTSVAAWSIVPAQDLLALGSEARMNTPAEAEGNWTWRLQPGALDDDLAALLRELTEITGRLPR